MKVVYIDSNFKCHTTNNGNLTSVETDFFDNKCNTFIEGYCLVPDGSSWTREDGKVFYGEMAFPWKSYDELEGAQRAYESQLLAEYTEALKIMGVSV